MDPRFRPAFRRPAVLAATAGILLILAAVGCDGSRTAGPEPKPAEEGVFITDTVYTLDEFTFDSLACGEVFPAGSVSSDARPPEAPAALRLISTSCYHVTVKVLTAAKDTLRTFDSRFAIFNRSEADKNRGVPGYLAWDGKDDKGAVVPEGLYLWRLEFDFGKGRIRKFRTDFLLR